MEKKDHLEALIRVRDSALFQLASTAYAAIRFDDVGSESDYKARQGMEYFLMLNQIIDILKAEISASDPSQAGQD